MNQQVARRDFLKRLGLSAAGLALGQAGLASRAYAGDARRPNFIVIFCDDMGYGDLGCFGSKKHRTANLDRMAEEGTRFTSFYVTSGVCTPSRSSLMTGCYPRRVTMHHSVLFPIAKRGLHPSEITIAEVLKPLGYATACIGKWHLGDQREFLPTRQGFDYYFGLPYSNDMQVKRRGDPPLPLLRNETVIEAPAQQDTLTKRYTEETIRFITVNKDRPFFVYLPHSMVHNPVHASEGFRGKSANGRYGDATEEVDWSTGEIIKTLQKLGVDEHTLVLFTSDNGASNRWGGSNAPLSGFKGSTMEGGMREPCIVRWPGRIPAGRACDEMAITMDLLPTFARLAGTRPPGDRTIDGRDIWPLMAGEPGAKTPHEAFYYYRGAQLQAVRSGKWKLHLPRPASGKGKKRRKAKPAKLVDLLADVAEESNVAEQHPDVVKRLAALADRARADLGDGSREGADQRPAGMVVTPVPLLLPGQKYEPPKTVFELKQGDSLPSRDAPRVGRRGISIAARINAAGRDGVIVAQGGIAVGYTLYVREGLLCMGVRRSREELTTVRSETPLPGGPCSISATLSAKGAVTLVVDGQTVAAGKAPGPLPTEPAEHLVVGSDQRMPVGEYKAPFAFAGRIHEVVIRIID